MRKRHRSRLQFVLGMTTLIVLLGVTAGLWWWLPAHPRLAWTTPSPCLQFILSKDGQTLLTVHDEDMVIWDVESAMMRQRLAIDKPHGANSWFHYVNGPWLSPNGQTVAYQAGPFPGSGTERQTWLLNLGSKPILLPDVDYILEDVLFTPDSQQVITTSPSQVRETATGQRRPTGAQASRLRQSKAHIGADGRMVAIGVDEDNSLTVRDLLSDEVLLRRPEDNRGLFDGVELTDDGRLLAYAERDGIHLYQLPSGKPGAVLGLKEDQNFVPDRFSPDGRLLVIDSYPWGPVLRAGSHVLRPQAHIVWDVSVAPPRQLAVWQMAQTGPRFRISYFSPDSRWCIADTTGKNEYWLHETTTMQPIRRLQSYCAFAPDSRSYCQRMEPVPSFLTNLLGLAKQPPVDDLVIWEVETGSILATIPNCSNYSYRPDGKSLVMLSQDRTVQLWDIPPRRPWYIEYGLPVGFAVLVLLGGRMVWRAVRRPVTMVTT